MTIHDFNLFFTGTTFGMCITCFVVVVERCVDSMLTNKRMREWEERMKAEKVEEA